jgi:hypothetical protein
MIVLLWVAVAVMIVFAGIAIYALTVSGQTSEYDEDE